MHKQLICGLETSGKTTALRNLHAANQNGIFLPLIQPLTDWFKIPEFVEHLEANQIKAKQSEMLTHFVHYLKDKDLYLDDLQSLRVGKKCELLKEILNSNPDRIVVASVLGNESQIHPSLKAYFEKAEKTALAPSKSWKPTYDFTSVAVGIIILISAALGFYETTLLLGALQLMSRGGKYHAKY